MAKSTGSKMIFRFDFILSLSFFALLLVSLVHDDVILANKLLLYFQNRSNTLLCDLGTLCNRLETIKQIENN